MSSTLERLIAELDRTREQRDALRVKLTRANAAAAARRRRARARTAQRRAAKRRPK